MTNNEGRLNFLLQVRQNYVTPYSSTPTDKEKEILTKLNDAISILLTTIINESEIKNV